MAQSTLEELPRDAEFEALIRSCVAELDERFGCIDGCHVVIEPAVRHPLLGRRSQVVIEIDVGDERLVVRGRAVDDFPRERAHQAIREAFAAMHRELEDHVRFHREDPEAHARHFR